MNLLRAFVDVLAVVLKLWARDPGGMLDVLRLRLFVGSDAAGERMGRVLREYDNP